MFDRIRAEIAQDKAIKDALHYKERLKSSTGMILKRMSSSSLHYRSLGIYDR